MITERERCLELLGLKAGASAQEIKAAYRDLAKVWHPDRFAHDPRLQLKAQDKLKELNEAYEALTSNDFNRGTRADAGAPRREPNAEDDDTRSTRATSRYQWPTTFLVACLVATGLFFSPRLLQRETNETTGAASVTGEPDREETSEREEANGNRRERRNVEKQKAPATTTYNSAPAEPGAMLRPLPTVTVTIDPTTGLLARADCPTRSSMTYPAGQEPHQYCSAEHRQIPAATEAPPDSKKRPRLKSLANRLAAPARWLNEKSQLDNSPSH